MGKLATGRLIKRKGASKFRGVSYDKKLKKWRGQFCYGYNVIYVGIYESEEDAFHAVNRRRDEYVKGLRERHRSTKARTDTWWDRSYFNG